MPRGRSYRSAASRRPSVKTAWYNDAAAPQHLAAPNQGFYDMFSNMPSGFAGGLTNTKILRALVEVSIEPDVAGARFYGAFGISLISRDAAALGSIPDPATDLTDWYLLKRYSSTVDAVGKSLDFTFDLRSSRNVRGSRETGMTPAFVMQNLVGGIEWQVGFRLLLQMP